MSFTAGVAPCSVCGKRVYGAERADADGRTFHKTCLRCSECNCVVKLGSYAALGGKFYCKPHFKQLFARSGNYHGAFEGQTDPKAKWLNGENSPAASPKPALRRCEVAEQKVDEQVQEEQRQQAALDEKRAREAAAEQDRKDTEEKELLALASAAAAAEEQEAEEKRMADEKKEADQTEFKAHLQREEQQRELEHQRQEEEKEREENEKREREDQSKRDEEERARERAQKAEEKGNEDEEARIEGAASEEPMLSDSADISAQAARVKELRLLFVQQITSRDGSGSRGSITSLKQEGVFVSIRDRWQFGQFAGQKNAS